MPTFLQRAENILAKLDQFLDLFADMANQQRNICAQPGSTKHNTDVLGYMLPAQEVFEERRRHLRDSRANHEVSEFLHQLALLASDPKYIEFVTDMAHLRGIDPFKVLLEELSLEPRLLLRDLDNPANEATFAAELTSRP